jgi:hypothetical protein
MQIQALKLLSRDAPRISAQEHEITLSLPILPEQFAKIAKIHGLFLCRSPLLYLP